MLNVSLSSSQSPDELPGHGAGHLLVMTTCADGEAADQLAAVLVRESLAACVNTVRNITSTYRWDGRIQQDSEALLLIKTTAERFPALEQAIQANHSYEVPEVIALPINGGSTAYLDWLSASTGGADRNDR